MLFSTTTLGIWHSIITSILKLEFWAVAAPVVGTLISYLAYRGSKQKQLRDEFHELRKELSNKDVASVRASAAERLSIIASLQPELYLDYASLDLAEALLAEPDREVCLKLVDAIRLLTERLGKLHNPLLLQYGGPVAKLRSILDRPTAQKHAAQLVQRVARTNRRALVAFIEAIGEYTCDDDNPSDTVLKTLSTYSPITVASNMPWRRTEILEYLLQRDECKEARRRHAGRLSQDACDELLPLIADKANRLMNLRTALVHCVVFALTTGSRQRLELDGCFMPEIFLPSSNLEYVSLENSVLFAAVISESNLRMANLCGSDLRWIALQNSNLTDALLNHADLEGAAMCNAHLSNAIIKGANFTKADLTAAKFSQYPLHTHGAIFTKAKYSDETMLPVDINPDEVGMINTSRQTDQPSMMEILGPPNSKPNV